MSDFESAPKAPSGSEQRSREEIEDLLTRVNGGDAQALNDLLRLVQVELHALAHSLRNKWSPAPSLVTTELLSEAYLRIFGGATPSIHDRKHFFCLAARTMRWIIISHHRRRAHVVELDSQLHGRNDQALSRSIDVLALSDALERLERFDPELAQIVELKFFLELHMDEISAVMGVPERTLYRLWERAKSWLYRELGRGYGDDPHGAGEGAR
jgi:RNA polymerase sigma factor (TIGR02999 family)